MSDYEQTPQQSFAAPPLLSQTTGQSTGRLSVGGAQWPPPPPPLAGAAVAAPAAAPAATESFGAAAPAAVAAPANGHAAFGSAAPPPLLSSGVKLAPPLLSSVAGTPTSASSTSYLSQPASPASAPYVPASQAYAPAPSAYTPVTSAYTPAPAPTHQRSASATTFASGGAPAPPPKHAPSASSGGGGIGFGTLHAVSSTSSEEQPALAAIRQELNEILDVGHSTFAAQRDFKQHSKELKKIDPDGRLTAMVNRLWYRFAFLVNAKYPGMGSALTKEAILVLMVLCEVRQSVVDVFEFSKAQGDKVSLILTRHAWLFDTARRLEALAAILLAKVAAAVEGKVVKMSTTYTPQLLDAPLALFEDRIGNYTPEQQAELMLECPGLKTLRGQVETQLSLAYEPALISLCITEAVGKAVGILLPQKERRKLFFSSLLSTYAVSRASSWMLMKSNHSIDLSKSGAGKLAQSAGTAGTASIANAAAQAHGLGSVGAVDLLRQTASSTTRALPTEEVLRQMLSGQVLTGYFSVPGVEEPIMQRMFVWYDLLEGTAGGDASKLIGKKGALWWVPEKAPRVKSEDMSLPIGDITDILLGKQTKVFQSVAGSKANPACCVTLVSKGGYSMNFEAASKVALTTFMAGLSKLASAGGKTMSEGKGEVSSQPPTQEQIDEAHRVEQEQEQKSAAAAAAAAAAGGSTSSESTSTTSTPSHGATSSASAAVPSALPSSSAAAVPASPASSAAAIVAGVNIHSNPDDDDFSAASAGGDANSASSDAAAATAQSSSTSAEDAEHEAAQREYERQQAEYERKLAEYQAYQAAQAAQQAAGGEAAAAEAAPASDASAASASSGGGKPNGGWIRCLAPDGFNYYYYNADTKTSVWVAPPEYVGEPEA